MVNSWPSNLALILIHWKVFYPLDSVIQRLNNRDLNKGPSFSVELGFQIRISLAGFLIPTAEFRSAPKPRIRAGSTSKNIISD